MKTVLIYSGGADSTTLLYHLLDNDHDVMCLTFDYGQRHRKEVGCARNVCIDLNVPWQLINLRDFVKVTTSALLGDGGIPYGHYEEESMKQTVVPNRNMVML